MSLSEVVQNHGEMRCRAELVGDLRGFPAAGDGGLRIAQPIVGHDQRVEHGELGESVTDLPSQCQGPFRVLQPQVGAAQLGVIMPGVVQRLSLPVRIVDACQEH
nr:hypothetical protein [Catenulispora acidiphila]